MNPRSKKILLYAAIGAVAIYIVLLIMAKTGALAKLRAVGNSNGGTVDEERHTPTTITSHTDAQNTNIPTPQPKDYPLRKNLSQKWSAVYKLQKVLKNQGRLYGANDAVWGPKTEQGLRELRTATIEGTTTAPLKQFLQLDSTGSIFIANINDLNSIIRWHNANTNTKLTSTN